MLVGLFLMFVILLQRGRGGGLAGAFGGLGGQSAFGTKAGDVFTVITIVTVCLWVVVACLAGWRLRVEDHDFAMQDRPDAVEDKDEVKTDSNKKAAKPGDEDQSDEKQPAEKSEEKSSGKAAGAGASGDKEPPADGTEKASDAKPDSQSKSPDETSKKPATDEPEAGDSKKPE
jgi:preprotein translocase subunit SecG